MHKFYDYSVKSRFPGHACVQVETRHNKKAQPEIVPVEPFIVRLQ